MSDAGASQAQERQPFDKIDHFHESDFDIIEQVDDRIDTSTYAPGRPPGDGSNPRKHRNLLRQETVPMTILAQDPEIRGPLGQPVIVQIPVPADRLQRGPRNHRFHVVDVAVGTGNTHPPVILHDDDPWCYVDRFAGRTDVDALAADRDFRAQNVFAIAAHTLALFERHLGRRVPWQSGWPHLYLVPEARIEGNAGYSQTHCAVLFGWLPKVSGLPSVRTALSYDVIAHEMTHAILDGLRPRYVEPSLPDQLAFHEALADVVAMFSVFGLDGVAEQLLPIEDGVIAFPGDEAAARIEDRVARAAERKVTRAEFLKRSPLLGLAEQLGRRLQPQLTLRAESDAVDAHDPPTALRRSVEMASGVAWKTDATFEEPHRRAEVLVAAFMQTFVRMWAGRLEPLGSEAGGLDGPRVVEEGVKASQHLLGMLIRALDYLPPIELEFADVIDCVLTADARLAPDDDHRYRDELATTFEEFGIVPPQHRMIDRDGNAAPVDASAAIGPDGLDSAPPVDPATATGSASEVGLAPYPPDPDASDPKIGLRYEHLNFTALRTSPEEVFQFLWSNSRFLGLDVRLATRVDRVLATTRVGPDGLILNEVVADYRQWIRTTGANLPPRMEAPEGMDPDADIELWGGGVLVFDQFGRFRLHQRKPVLDVERQNARLKYLHDRGLHDRDGGFGTTDGLRSDRRFAMLHQDSDEGTW